MRTIKQQARAAKAGDNEAFLELVQGYEKVMYNTVRRWIKNEEDIADILQDTILKAYENLHTLRQPENFNTWIYRILINQCNQYFRNEHQELDLSGFPVSHEMNTTKLELEELLCRLSPKYKVPLVLFCQVGYSLKELSEMLGEPIGTIKSRIHRAKQMLKDNENHINRVKGGG